MKLALRNPIALPWVTSVSRAIHTRIDSPPITATCTMPRHPFEYRMNNAANAKKDAKVGKAKSFDHSKQKPKTMLIKPICHQSPSFDRNIPNKQSAVKNGIALRTGLKELPGSMSAAKYSRFSVNSESQR